MIETKNVTILMVKDNRTIIKDFHFTIQPGDKIAIIGEEGNGKSTLLKLIYDEQLIANYCTYEGKINRNDYLLGFLSQELTADEKNMTITDLFKENNWNKNLLQAMDDFGISSLVSDKQLVFLSGGERFKYRFLQLLASDPDVLLLDEPTNDLDLQTMEWLEGFIQETTIPVLFVSHDETFITNTANGIIHMEQTQRKQVPRYTISREPYEAYLSIQTDSLNKQEQVAKKQASDHKKQMTKWNDLHSSLKIGYMPQNYENLLDVSKTPISFLETTGEKEAITKAFTHLGSMKFTSDEMHHPMEKLSGGQKAKLLLLKMILNQCEVLILDEPTRNFSPLTTPVLCQALSAFEGVIISISHDRRYLNEVATAIYELTSEGLTKMK